MKVTQENYKQKQLLIWLIWYYNNLWPVSNLYDGLNLRNLRPKILIDKYLSCCLFINNLLYFKTNNKDNSNYPIYFFIFVSNQYNFRQMKKNQQLLTQQQAQKRVKLIQEGSVRYTLCLDFQQESCQGIIQITFNMKKLGELFLDFRGELTKLNVNKKSLKIQDFFDENFIVIESQYLNLGKNVIMAQFATQYSYESVHIKLAEDTDKRRYIYGSFQPYQANYVFPCFDQPNIKGKLKFIGIHTPEWELLSNELIVQQQFTQVKQIEKFIEERQQNKTVTHFQETELLPTYLFTFAAGDHSEETPKKSYKNLKTTIYSLKSNSKQLKQYSNLIWELIDYGLEFFQKFFNIPYPFSKCEIIFTREFSTRGMQHPGLLMFDQDYITRAPLNQNSQEAIIDLAQTLLHEIAHCWFGNLVTMNWWDDLWLNQSFADYMGFFALQKIKHKIKNHHFATAMISFKNRKIWGYEEDNYSTTHPVKNIVRNTDEAGTNFDGITYSKGGSILKQIMFIIGQEKFAKACHEYFEKFAWKNSVYDDLIFYLKKYFSFQKLTLDEYQNEWLNTKGHNILTPRRNKNNIEIIQENSRYSETLRHHKLNLSIFDENAKKETIVVNVQNQLTVVPYGKDLSKKYFLLNDDDHCFVKTRFDPESFEFFSYNITKVQNPLTRCLIWINFFEDALSARLRSDKYVQIVLRNIERQGDIGVLEIVLENINYVIQNCTPKNKQSELKEKTFDKILKLMENEKVKWNQKLKILQTNLILNSSTQRNSQILLRCFNQVIYKNISFESIELADYLILSPFLGQMQKINIMKNLAQVYDQGDIQYLNILRSNKFRKMKPEELDSEYKKLLSDKQQTSNTQKEIALQAMKSNEKWYQNTFLVFHQFIVNKLTSYSDDAWKQEFLKIFLKNQMTEQEIARFQGILPKLKSDFSLATDLRKKLQAARDKIQCIKLYA